MNERDRIRLANLERHAQKDRAHQQVPYGAVVNLREEGGKGDYVSPASPGTDDSTAFEACITKALALKLPLYIPAGAYGVTRRVAALVGQNGLTVFGDGMYRSIIKQRGVVQGTTSTYYEVIRLQDCTNIDLFAFAFEGENTTLDAKGRPSRMALGGEAAGVRIYGAATSHIRVENMRFEYFFGHGFHCIDERAQYVGALNCVASHNGKNGLNINGTYAYMIGCIGESNQFGLFEGLVHHGRLLNNHAENCNGAGIALGGAVSDGYIAPGTLVNNNVVLRCRAGIAISGGAHYSEVANNYVRYSQRHGIIISRYTYARATIAWAASTVKAASAIISVVVGGTARAFIATVAGTTGASEPTWPTVIGGTVVDGTLTWRYEGNADWVMRTRFNRIHHNTCLDNGLVINHDNPALNNGAGFHGISVGDSDNIIEDNYCRNTANDTEYLQRIGIGLNGASDCTVRNNDVKGHAIGSSVLSVSGAVVRGIRDFSFERGCTNTLFVPLRFDTIGRFQRDSIYLFQDQSGFVDTNISFEAIGNRIRDPKGRLRNLFFAYDPFSPSLSPGDNIYVTGAATAANNGMKVVATDPVDYAGVVVTATTISFATSTPALPATLTNSAGGLTVFAVGSRIRISGAAVAANNRTVLVKSVTSTVLTLDQAMANEAVGASITITAGDYLEVVETLVDGAVGPSITLTNTAGGVVTTPSTAAIITWQILSQYASIAVTLAAGAYTEFAAGYATHGGEYEDGFSVTPQGGIEDGLEWQTFVTNVNALRIRLYNRTAASVVTAARNWNIQVTKRFPALG